VAAFASSEQLAIGAASAARPPNIVYFVTDDQDQTSAVLLFYAFIYFLVSMSSALRALHLPRALTTRRPAVGGRSS